MIENRIQAVAISSISIPREHRQRSDLTPESVVDLAYSIGQTQWISPILIDKDTMTIIAGERRTTAVQLLQRVWEADETLPESFLDRLAPVSKCKIPSWENWTRIPAQFGNDLTEIECLTFEFVENKERLDLPWQDKAKAVYDIHAKCLAQSHAAGSSWTAGDTANLVGLSASVVSRYLQAWRAAEKQDPKLEEIIREAPTLQSAIQAIDRVESRREEKPRITLGAKPAPKPAEPTSESPVIIPPARPKTLADSLLLNEDFHEFAAKYTGSPFNFLHIDFPYGISFNTSVGQSTAIDTTQLGTYDDSEEVYWQLLRTLHNYSDTLIAPSAHIMFWFSQNLRRRTEDFFHTHFPSAVVQDFLMIWHTSDNSGICPDPNRYGRRTYETAFLLTFGDRKIVTPKALSFAHPRGRGSDTKIHRSQKPVEVLSHFFSMFVDDTSTVFDPTAGSGTALLAAKRLGASSALGLELDSDMHSAAVKHLNEELSK